MKQEEQNSPDGSGAAAAPAPAPEKPADRDAPSDRFCLELSRLFQVQPTEVALLRMEDGRLQFLFPGALRAAGSIPVSSISAIAAHTAVSKKAEFYNSFTRTKHASVFETVKLGQSEDNTPLEKPIQRLMSAPVVDASGEVLGVIQVCRKGFDLASAGPEFIPADLAKLEHAAKTAGDAAFMRDISGTPRR